MCNSGAPTTAPTSDPTGVPTSEPTLDTDGRAALYWTCDDESEVYLSRDNRATWELLETTSSWATTGEVWIEDIDPTVDVIRVHCTNSGGGYGGLMATVHYQFDDYPTTDPIDDGAWTYIADESSADSFEYYGPKSDPPSRWSSPAFDGISDDAYWIWGRDGASITTGTMVFELQFQDVTQAPTTAAPTTAEPTTDPSADPTTSPSNNPSPAPTTSPSLAPSAAPTADPTTPWPTLAEVIEESATMYLEADFSDLQSYADENGLSNEDVALMIVESAMNLDGDPSLSNVQITITEVREGSVIIDYTLESAVDGVVALALDNIEDTVGESITISDDFVLVLDKNKPVTTPAPSPVEVADNPVEAAGAGIGGDTATRFVML